jgi:hypothetical protein
MLATCDVVERVKRSGSLTDLVSGVGDAPPSVAVLRRVEVTSL